MNLTQSSMERRPEWVQHFEAALAEYYREPVMPVSRYCKAFSDWGKALREKAERDEKADDHRDESLHKIAEMAMQLELAIRKSNLLARLIYGGQELRTEMCPTHKGEWSGCNFDAPFCECQDGSDVTGWLP